MFKRSPNGRGMVLIRSVFRNGNRHGKRYSIRHHSFSTFANICYLLIRKIFAYVLNEWSLKDKMSNKISCMHYMKWTRVMLPVAFEEFELFYIFFCYFFLFPIIVNW